MSLTIAPMSAELRKIHGPGMEAPLLPPVAPPPAPEGAAEPLLTEDGPEVPDELVCIGDTQRQ
jgi:hypothetical protein